MFDILIFSKDRACQCDLLIRSIIDHLKIVCPITLQYTFSDKCYEDGYKKLKEKYSVIKFIHEDNFQNTFKTLLNGMHSEFFLSFTDDDVVINNVDMLELAHLVNEYRADDNIHTISLRMNEKINYCYPARTAIKAPPFMQCDKYLLWNWTKAENQNYCWGYPMAIQGHIYPTRRLCDTVMPLNFHNVNSLEACLNRNRWQKPYMIGFNETKVFNVQNNFVQGQNTGNFEKNFSTAFLNAEWLDGKILDTMPLYGMKPTQAHGTAEYILI